MPGFLPINPRLPLIWHGGDYNPEQWSAAERYVCLASPTAAQPAWMSRGYPEVLRADSNGVRMLTPT